MEIVKPFEHTMSDKTMGRVGNATLGATNEVCAIYQRQHFKKGVKIVRKEFYTYNTTRTEARGICRDKFKNAINAYHELSTEEQQEWRERAKGTRLTGFNLFIKKYMFELI